MIKKFFGISFLCVFVLATVIAPALVQEQEVFTNGLIQLSFSRRTGLFEAASASRASFCLVNAGPCSEKDEETVSARDVTKSEIDCETLED